MGRTINVDSWEEIGKALMEVDPADAYGTGKYMCHFCPAETAYAQTLSNQHYLANHDVDCLWRRAWELFKRINP